MKPKSKNGKFMSLVKVGPKGQIVIPKEVREMFDISAGNSLLLLADSQKGIAIERYGVFEKIADEIFSGKAKQLYPELNQDDCVEFANAIREAGVEK